MGWRCDLGVPTACHPTLYLLNGPGGWPAGEKPIPETISHLSGVVDPDEDQFGSSDVSKAIHSKFSLI